MPLRLTAVDLSNTHKCTQSKESKAQNPQFNNAPYRTIFKNIIVDIYYTKLSQFSKKVILNTEGYKTYTKEQGPGTYRSVVFCGVRVCFAATEWNSGESK